MAGATSANELVIDRKSVLTSEGFTVTVYLDGPFAAVEDLTIPTKNATLEEPPSVESVWQIINLHATQRRVFRYAARPGNPGPATIGPIEIRLPNGERDMIPAQTIDIAPDRASGSNDPLTVLRELVAAGRPPTFVVARADKTSVLQGEEVVVTWELYNASVVERWGMAEEPRMPDFWVEELAAPNVRPERIILDNLAVEHVDIRRVALFPLRSGRLVVPPLTIAATVMSRNAEPDVFGRFEGHTEEVRWRSAPLEIEVKPLPPGPPVDVVGDVALHCTQAAQANGGPVSLTATLSGRANLRGAPPPHFETEPDGTVQVEEGKVTVLQVAPGGGLGSLSRQWRFLLFPRHDGTFTVPPLATTILATDGTRHTLRCEARTIAVTASDTTLPQAAANEPRTLPRAAKVRWLPYALAAIVLVIAAWLFGPRVLATRRRRAAAARLVHGRAAGEIQADVDARLDREGIDRAALLTERSDRADAYRALRSLTDALAHDRLERDERELKARVMEVLIAFEL